MENNNAVVAEQSVNNEGVEQVAAEEPKVEEGSEVKTEETAKKPEEDFVPFPKKAQNALSRRDRTIGRLQARLREMEAKYNEKTQAESSTKQPEDKGPQEKDFDTYGEFIEARAEWRAEKKFEQKFAERDKAAKEATKNQLPLEQQQFIAMRSKEIEKKSAEYSTSIPDFDDVQEENLEIVANLPQGIKMAMLEADDPAIAFYNLAKDGTLADLANMTPTKAAMVIALASQKVPSKPTQAPKPMQGAKGVGQSTSDFKIAKDSNAMREWLKKKGIN